MTVDKTSTINTRMTDNEASARYPKSYIIMQFDDMNSEMGTVLFIFDTEREACEKLTELGDLDLLGIVEGLHHQRSLGGIVVGS